MSTLYTNNAQGTLSGSATVGDTTLSSAVFAVLPTVASPDVVWLVVDPEAVGGAPEIVKVTAHTAAASTVRL